MLSSPPFGGPIKMIGTSEFHCRIELINTSSRDLYDAQDSSGGEDRKSTVPNMMLIEVGGPLKKAGAYRSRYFANDKPTFGWGSIAGQVEPSYCLHCVPAGSDGSTTTSPIIGDVGYPFESNTKEPLVLQSRAII